MTSFIDESVVAHYGRGGLAERIIAAIEASGLDADQLTPDDLAPVDEFHTAGRETTLEALRLMPLEPGMHVLDAGCGIGGTARVLASEHDCRVTGIDLTPEYVEVARMLTARLKLDEQCRFEVGSVTRMPFADDTFDAAVSFHVAMNVADRRLFYRELARVLRPDAPVCIFDVMKGPAPGMVYPVPWAESEATSFLRSRYETCWLLEEAGFDVRADRCLREFALDHFRNVFLQAADGKGPPPLGLHLLVGANASEKFANFAKGLAAHQIEPVILVAARSAAADDRERTRPAPASDHGSPDHPADRDDSRQGRRSHHPS